jgi:hypothetical protein
VGSRWASSASGSPPLRGHGHQRRAPQRQSPIAFSNPSPCSQGRFAGQGRAPCGRQAIRLGSLTGPLWAVELFLGLIVQGTEGQDPKLCGLEVEDDEGKKRMGKMSRLASGRGVIAANRSGNSSGSKTNSRVPSCHANARFTGAAQRPLTNRTAGCAASGATASWTRLVECRRIPTQVSHTRAARLQRPCQQARHAREWGLRHGVPPLKILRRVRADPNPALNVLPD